MASSMQGPSQQHAVAGTRDAFHPTSHIAPVPRSSSLPFMGHSQSKQSAAAAAAPSTPTSSVTASKGLSAAVAGGIKLKRAFAAKRKKTGEGSSSSPAALSPAPSSAPSASNHQRPTVLTTSPLSASSTSSYYYSKSQSHQAQAPSQQQAVSSPHSNLPSNHPPSPTNFTKISLPPVSKKQQQEQTLGSHPSESSNISNVPGGPLPSSPRLAQQAQLQLQSHLPLTTTSPSATTPLSSATMSLSPPSTSNTNRSSVIPLSPGITSAVTYISMLDQQEQAMMVKQREEAKEKQREEERQREREKGSAREQKEEQEKKQLPQPPTVPQVQSQPQDQPQRRQLPTPPTSTTTFTSLVSGLLVQDVDASPSSSSSSTVATTVSTLPSLPTLPPLRTTDNFPAPTPAASLPTPPLSSLSSPSKNDKDKESWRKSDSTNSYHTIRPPRPTLNASTSANRASYASSYAPSSPSPTATSRPVSWAESFQSARTVVQGQGGQGGGNGRPLSALFVGGGVAKVEESEEEGMSSDDEEGKRRRSEDNCGGSSEEDETEESEGESDIGLDNADTASSMTSASAASSSKASSLISANAPGKKIVLKRRSMSLGDASQFAVANKNTTMMTADKLSPKKIKQPSLSISEGVPVSASVPRLNPQPKSSGTNLRGRLAAWAGGSSGPSAPSLTSFPSSSSSSVSSIALSEERDLPALPATSPASPLVPGVVFGPGPQSLHMWSQHASQSSMGSLNNANANSGSYDQSQQKNATSGTSNLMQMWQGGQSQARQAVFPQQIQQQVSYANTTYPQQSQRQHAASGPHTRMPPPPQHSYTNNQTLGVPQAHQPSRSPAISLTSSGFGLAKRAVEKMGKWGFGSSNSASAPSSYKDYGIPPAPMLGPSGSTSSVSGSGIMRGMTGTPPPPNLQGNTGPSIPSSSTSSFVQGMSIIGYAMQRVASGSHSHSGSTSGHTSSSEDKVGKKERKEREKREKAERERTRGMAGNAHVKSPSSVSSASIGGGLPVPASPSKRSHHLFGSGQGHVAAASISSAWSMDSSRNPGDHDPQIQLQQQQQYEGPSLGRLVRIPMIPVSKMKGGGSGGGGLVFRRELRLCVKDTGIWVGEDSVKKMEKRTNIDGLEVSEETLALIRNLEEERRVPALVVRCAQHLLLWGVQEEGLFRVSGMPSHVSKLRAEFDAGADYDMTECNPGDLDPHAVASVFKAYLRELPEPLLTKKLQHEFDAAIKQETNLNTAADASRTAGSLTGVPSNKAGLPAGPKNGLRKPPSLSTLAMPSFTGIPPASASLLAILRSLIQQLPRENKDLVRTVVDLIKATSKESKKTKMPLSNLLLVFCPSLGMTPPLLKVLCEGDGIWGEKVVEKETTTTMIKEDDLDLEEVIDIRRMTIKAVPQKAKEDLDDDRSSRVSVDTTSTDRYSASEESAAEEDEHDFAASSSASLIADQEKRQRRRDASIDLRAAELELEQENERRQSEVPTVYLDSRSHLSSSSSSIAPEITPGPESSNRSFAQMQQFPSSPSASSSSSNRAASKHMKRRSIGLLSLSSFSSAAATPPLVSPAGSSSPSSAGRASFPGLGFDDAGQQSNAAARTVRMKKPSLKLLFSKMSTAAGSPANATVGGRTISGPILNHATDSEDEDEYGQSSISTPISAVTAPQSSIPGPNSSPRLNHKGSTSQLLSVTIDNVSRSRSSSTASSHLPPVLDTPIENPSLEALDGMFGGFDVSPPTTAMLVSTAAPMPSTASVTSPVSATRRPVIGRGRKLPPTTQVQSGGATNDSKVSLASGSGSSSTSSGSALSSGSSASLASSHHLSFGRNGQQETMEEWTRSVLLAASDVSSMALDLDLEGWESIGGKESGKTQN